MGVTFGNQARVNKRWRDLGPLDHVLLLVEVLVEERLVHAEPAGDLGLVGGDGRFFQLYERRAEGLGLLAHHLVLERRGARGAEGWEGQVGQCVVCGVCGVCGVWLWDDRERERTRVRERGIWTRAGQR